MCLVSKTVLYNEVCMYEAMHIFNKNFELQKNFHID